MTTPHAEGASELTLDPGNAAEWEDFNLLAHRMVDDMLAHMAGLRDGPAWQEMPTAVSSAFQRSPPMAGKGAEAAYAEFLGKVLPYSTGNAHPRFFGWVQGNGTPLGMMADMLAAGMNPHMAGFNQAPPLVEQQVIAWMSELMGMPGATGLFVTGGSMANTLGLAVGRYAKTKELGIDVREDGLQLWPGEDPHAPLVFYGSSETHGWARKAAELLGLGNRSFRRIETDSEFRLDIGSLRSAITADRRAGLIPFCVIGTAGTVNTGTSDNLEAIADLCVVEKLWFHVDGAFGALAFLSSALRPQVSGMERADSIGFDLHKWGYLPFECACALIRNPSLHREAFAATASYLEGTTRGVIAGGLPFADRGIDLTRGFKALKVWMSLESHGVNKLVRMIEQNVAQTRYLAEIVEANENLELMAPAPLNIVCFRYVSAGIEDSKLDGLNEELLLRLQESGFAVPSSTRLNGRFALRFANVNHRTKLSDIDMVVEEILRLGSKLSQGNAE